MCWHDPASHWQSSVHTCTQHLSQEDIMFCHITTKHTCTSQTLNWTPQTFTYHLLVHFAVYMKFYLAFHLTFSLAFFMASWSHILISHSFCVFSKRKKSGESHSDFRAVKARQGPQRSGTGRCSPATRQMKSGEPHCNHELASDVQRGGGRKEGRKEGRKAGGRHNI